MGSPKSDDPYAVLGVDRHASLEVIRGAFRRAARLAHPDAGGDPTHFVALRRAFEVLIDPVARAELDAMVGWQPGEAVPPRAGTSSDRPGGVGVPQTDPTVRASWPALEVAWRWSGGQLVPMPGGGLVVGLSDPETLEARAPGDGDRRWRVGLGAAAVATPVCSGVEVIVATEDGIVHGLDAGSGQTRWERRLTEVAGGLVEVGGQVAVVGPTAITAIGPGGDVRWAVRPAGGIAGAVSAGPVLVVGTWARTVVGTDPQSGATRWWFRTQSAWPVRPVLVGGVLWLAERRRDTGPAGGRSGSSLGDPQSDVLVGVDPRTGAAVQSLRLPTALHSMHDVGGLLILRDVTGGLTAVRSGQPRWRVLCPASPSEPTLLAGSVAVATADGTLRFLASSSGHEVHQLGLGASQGDPQSVVAVDAGGLGTVVVVTGSDGGAVVHRQVTPRGEPSPQ